MAISSGVIVTPLSLEETAKSGYTHRCRIPYTTVTTIGGANTTATVAIYDAQVGDVVTDRVGMYIREAWTDSDASLNSITVAVGDDGSTARFCSANQIAEDGTEIDHFAALGGGTAATSTSPFAYNTANTVDALFTVAGGGDPTCAEITAGSLDIFIQVFSLSKLSSGLV